MQPTTGKRLTYCLQTWYTDSYRCADDPYGWVDQSYKVKVTKTFPGGIGVSQTHLAKVIGKLKDAMPYECRRLICLWSRLDTIAEENHLYSRSIFVWPAKHSGT